MNAKVKGTLFGIISAISYGTNPLGALSLYKLGINTNSVLFYRFSIAAAILAIVMLVQKKSFAISKKELVVVSSLGILFGISSLSLFTSFHFMDAGVASTLLFIYPVMVAVIMAAFFKEHLSMITILSISLALGGICLLYQGDGGGALNISGVLLVLISSLSYAVYIVVVNKSSLTLSPVKLTFWVLLFCILTISVHSFTSLDYQIVALTSPSMWMWALMLAIVPTIISLLTMVRAVKTIGSTATAIMGALEPLTAVAIGITIFGEIFTFRLGMGILLILFGVTLIVGGQSINIKSIISKFTERRFLLRRHH